MTNAQSAEARGLAHKPPITGWAFLWRAPKLALAPQRLALAFFAVICLMGIGTIFDTARGDLDQLNAGVFETLSGSVIVGVSEAAQGVISLNPARIFSGIVGGFALGPAALAQVAPWSTAALALVLLPIWTLFGGAISRSAAVEIARTENLSSTNALAYAVSKSRSLIGAYLIPAVTAGVLAGILWLFGVALLSLPGLDIAGGLFYAIAIAIGFILALIVWGFAVGFPLLIPAVAADASDAVDAIQRTYSYILDKPFALLVWAAALIAQGTAGLFIIAVLVTTALNWTATLTGADTDPTIAGNITLFMPVQDHGEIEGTLGVAAAAMGVWERAALAILGAFAAQASSCAATLVYLRVRQASDGQAISDIWPRNTAIDAIRRGELEALADIHAD